MFNLIVSDIMMPGIDGFEFAWTVRELNAQIPILFMTAWDDIASKQRGCLAYPLYSRILEKERKRVAPEILQLTDELLQ